MFYDRSQSDMLRTLVSAGMRALEADKTAKEVKKWVELVKQKEEHNTYTKNRFPLF